MNATASISSERNVSLFWWSVITSPLFEIMVIFLVVAFGSIIFQKVDQRKGPAMVEVVQAKGS